MTITNICLLASGFGMLFLGLYFNSGYHMSRLYFISPWISRFSMTLICLGAIIAASSVFGVMASTTRSMILLRIYTVIIACLVLPQFFTTYISFQISALNVNKDMFRQGSMELSEHIKGTIGESMHSKEEWNFIEEDLRCCGDIDMTGYLFWQTHNSQEFTSIPKSCCVKKFGEVDEGCHWEDLFESTNHQRETDYPIYRIGCLTVLDHLYDKEVIPIINPVYLSLSVFIAIIEIASVALSAAYINVLRKKDDN